jgi:acetolactate synthase-1/2/3 large subunit
MVVISSQIPRAGPGGRRMGFLHQLDDQRQKRPERREEHGDRRAMYSIAELAVARQHNLPVTWLIIDEGGYGILREYMTEAFGAATATELARPNFLALAAAFSVPARAATPEALAAVLTESWQEDRPNVVVLSTRHAMFAHTHLT